MTALVRYLPRKWMSRMMGKILHIRGPWSSVLIWLFAGFYRINLAEAEKPYWSYPSLGEFFVRRLKTAMRPLAGAWAVHPADAVVTQCGEIVDGTLIQAKGLTYRLQEFIEDPDALLKYDKGTFLTYYLCPTDYHRVHSPVSGLIRSVTYMPGDLWPVNAWSTKNIPRLFRTNERVYVEIATELGPVGVVFVGATNVGSIEVFATPELKTNQGKRAFRHFLDVPQDITKGDELGMFRMGSTIVLLLGPEIRQKMNSLLVQPGGRTRVRSALTKS